MKGAVGLLGGIRQRRKESMRDFAIKRRRRKSAKRKLIDCLSFRIDEVNQEGGGGESGGGESVSLSQLHFCGLPKVCSCPSVLTNRV